MIESIKHYAYVGAEKTVAVGSAAVAITSKLCEEVGGVRALAGAVSSVIRALELLGKPVGALLPLAKTLETANKGLGVPHVFQRIHELTLDKTYKSMVFITSRISFLVKDVLTFYKFLQDMAIVSVATGKLASLSNLAPAFEYTGWGLDASQNLTDLYKDWKVKGAESLTFDRGCSLALDLTKLAAISFASGTTVTYQALRLGALFGTSAVKMTQQIHKHVNLKA